MVCVCVFLWVQLVHGCGVNPLVHTLSAWVRATTLFLLSRCAIQYQTHTHRDIRSILKQLNKVQSEQTDPTLGSLHNKYPLDSHAVLLVYDYDVSLLCRSPQLVLPLSMDSSPLCRAQASHNHPCIQLTIHHFTPDFLIHTFTRNHRGTYYSVILFPLWHKTKWMLTG